MSCNCSLCRIIGANFVPLPPWDQVSKQHYRKIIENWSYSGKSKSEVIKKMNEHGYIVSKKQLELKDPKGEEYIVFENKKNPKHKLTVNFMHGKAMGWFFHRKDKDIPEGREFGHM